MIFDLIGWVGVLVGLTVPLPQLAHIIKTGRVKNVSVGTYILLEIAMACYLIHAIYISAPVFIVAQGVNLVNNGVILFLLVRGKAHNV